MRDGGIGDIERSGVGSAEVRDRVEGGGAREGDGRIGGDTGGGGAIGAAPAVEIVAAGGRESWGGNGAGRSAIVKVAAWCQRAASGEGGGVFDLKVGDERSFEARDGVVGGAISIGGESEGGAETIRGGGIGVGGPAKGLIGGVGGRETGDGDGAGAAFGNARSGFCGFGEVGGILEVEGGGVETRGASDGVVSAPGSGGGNGEVGAGGEGDVMFRVIPAVDGIVGISGEGGSAKRARSGAII